MMCVCESEASIHTHVTPPCQFMYVIHPSQELEILEMMRSREGGGAAAAAGRGGSAEDDQRPPPPRQPLVSPCPVVRHIE